MSANISATEAQATVPAVRVQVVFHVTGDQQAHAVVARMVDRAHEIANLPECECDLDVSVERVRIDVAHPVDSGAASAHERPAGL